MPICLTEFNQELPAYQKVVLNKDEQRVMIAEITTQLGIGQKAVQEVKATFRYRKICCCLVPCLLMEKHKQVHINVTSQLLRTVAAKSDYFLLNIVSNDESSYHSFNPNWNRRR
jgi:hypothetical protein